MPSTKSIIGSALLHALLILPVLGFSGARLSTIKTTHHQHINRPTHLYYLDRDPVLEELSFKRPKSIASPAVADRSKSNATSTKQSTKNNSARGPSSKGSHSLKSTQSLTKTWNIRYNELLRFKEEHGHCLVPQHYPPNPKLGLWVMAQRRYYKLKSDKDKQLSKQHQHRIRMLKDIGFVFRVGRGPKIAKIDSLCTAKSGNKLEMVEDFMGYMIEKDGVYSEEEKKKAWKLRFRIYR